MRIMSMTVCMGINSVQRATYDACMSAVQRILDVVQSRRSGFDSHISINRAHLKFFACKKKGEMKLWSFT